MDRIASLEGLAADAQLWRIPTKGLSGLGCVIETRHEALAWRGLLAKL